jgi:predicted peroxiredoxin
MYLLIPFSGGSMIYFCSNPKLLPMKKTFCPLILLILLTTVIHAQTNSTTTTFRKMKFLIHVTQSPKDSTRAALAFLVAKTAIEEGHMVTLFLAGDAVKLLQEPTLSTLSGLGTGKLREHYDAIVKGNGRFYLSGNSSKARGVTEADLKDKPAEFALPNVLVKLAAESDRVFTY